jgi:ADP-heptose:LPS heptosyltransferase
MDQPRAILVLRFSSIGDIVQSTSPVGTLKSLFPHLRIDFMTLSKFAPLLEGHPHINRVFPIDIHLGYRSLKRIGKLVDYLDYDLVIDFHNTTRSRVIRSGIRKTTCLKVRKPRWARFKLFLFHKNDFHPAFNVRRWLHEPFHYYLPEEWEPERTRLFVSDVEKKQCKDHLLERGVSGPYVVITPGAAWAQKRWFPERYARLVDYFDRKYGLKTILLGGIGDEICDWIVKFADSTPVDLHGKTSLRESLSIISQAELVIGSDTGFLHAGEALNVPAITILGPTSQETGAGVYLPRSRAAYVENLWCRPCSQNGSFPCYRSEQFCMTGISVDQLTSEIESILSV